MTQPKNRNLLDQSNYRNPRYEQDAAALEELEKATQETEAQGIESDAKGKEQQEPQHDWEKRYKDLQSYNSRKINELTGQIKQLEQQSTPQAMEVPKTPEELEAFKDKHPEMFGVITTLANQQAQALLQQQDAKMAELTGDLMATKIERAMATLRQEHPDFEEITNSQQFHDWAAQQTTYVQDSIYNNPDDPSKASQALKLYKYEMGLGNNQQAVQQSGDLDVGMRSQTQEPNASDRNHPAYIWQESEIARMRPQEFAKWEEVITLAQREGRIAVGQ